MRIIHRTISEYAQLTGYIHEPSTEMDNIKAFPAILVLPGGAFRVCSDREGEPVAMAFYAEGYSAFVLDYTTVTKKPDATIDDPMNDCDAALSWIRQNTGELHLAEGKLAMIGFSGGGHLAASVATHGPQRPDLLLLGYPGIFPNKVRALICHDILERVDAQTPSSFIFSTRDDTVVVSKNPLAFAQALDEAGVEYELHIFRSGVHGLSLAKPLTSSGDRNQVNARFAQWFPLAVQWLKEKWNDFTVYGVNDGRTGRASIDSKISELIAWDRSASVVEKYLPSVRQLAKQYPELGGASIRAAAKWGLPLSAEMLAQLDSELLAL